MVVAIVGILIGLLMPAVQAARESSRRSACGNNLKQLGLAQHSFYETKQGFPPGRGGPAPTVFSPQAYLLPFVEQGGLHSQLDFSAAPTRLVIAGITYSGAANAKPAAQQLPVLQCASDPRAGQVPGSAFGATNYVACVGSGTYKYGTLDRADGVYFLRSRVRFADLIDGSSNTAAFSERMLGPGVSEMTPLPPDTGLYILELGTGVDVSPDSCATLGTGDWYGQRGAKWILGNYGNTLYNHYYVPNAAEWDCMSLPQQKGFFTARSYHPKGVNVLFCDGSTRFVADSVERSIWRAMSTRCGYEVAEMP